MAELDDILDEVRHHTRAAVATFVKGSGEAGPLDQVLALDQAVAAATAGGKAMRPALCVLAARAVGAAGLVGPQVWQLAAALELFQAAALIHDDIIDQSPTRRGMPAVHVAFEERHHQAGWSSDARRFGVAAAILAGDLALAVADHAAHTAAWGLAGSRGAQAWEAYRTMSARVVGGQYLDIAAEAAPPSRDGADDVARAWQVIDLKTAGYSAATPLQLGAIAAGAPPELSDRLYEIGMDLGRAFQLRDDLNGVFGDPDAAGKPVGADVREGKRTVLVATTMLRCPPADRADLAAALTHPPLDKAAVARLSRAMEDTGARRDVEAQVETLTEGVCEALGRLPLPGGAAMLIAAARRLTS